MALSKKPVTGMKDILPAEMQIRDYCISVIKDTYGKFGFTSIETPCVENIANLTSKQGGDNEKLIFKILKRGEKLNLETAKEEAGMVLIQDDRFNYIFVVRERENKRYLALEKTEKGTRTLIKEMEIEKTDRIYLTAQGCTEFYNFYFGYGDKEYIPFADHLDGTLLSSLVNEGFTGAYIGMYASSNKTESDNYADFDWFHYYY